MPASAAPSAPIVAMSDTGTSLTVTPAPPINTSAASTASACVSVSTTALSVTVMPVMVPPIAPASSSDELPVRSS